MNKALIDLGVRQRFVRYSSYDYRLVVAEPERFAALRGLF